MFLPIFNANDDANFQCVLNHSGMTHCTEPFTRSLARSLALHTHSPSPHCSLRSLAPLRSFVRSLARSLPHSGVHGKEIYIDELNASISYSFNPPCGGRGGF